MLETDKSPKANVLEVEMPMFWCALKGAAEVIAPTMVMLTELGAPGEVVDVAIALDMAFNALAAYAVMGESLDPVIRVTLLTPKILQQVLARVTMWRVEKRSQAAQTLSPEGNDSD